MTKVTDGSWRTSSFSGQEANCVQVEGALRKIRDSKNIDGPEIVCDVRALIAALKDGDLRR